MKICLFLSIMAIYFLSTMTYASEVHINGNHVIIKTDDGRVIDTNSLPNGNSGKNFTDVEINDDGISIGSVRNKNGEQKNIHRSTKLENVTIINNKEIHTYNSTKKDSSKEK